MQVWVAKWFFFLVLLIEFLSATQTIVSPSVISKRNLAFPLSPGAASLSQLFPCILPFLFGASPSLLSNRQSRVFDFFSPMDGRRR